MFDPIGAALRDAATGAVWNLDWGSVWKIGRLHSCQVRLEGELIARMHAVIEYAGAQWKLFDLGSTAGMWRNDERVHAVQLAQGDRLRVGERRLDFRLFPDAPRLTESEPPADALRRELAKGDLDALPVARIVAGQFLDGLRAAETAALGFARLRQIGDDAVLADIRERALARASDARESGVRSCAARALGWLGDAVSHRALEGLGSDPDPIVSASARAILAEQTPV